jgi:H+/gluconate symporter-like permease
LVVGSIAGLGVDKTVVSFGNGVGATVASVGTLIALGAIFGKLLADSGGADQIVDTIVGRASVRALPWAMALVGMIIGLPMFFEIGLVLLMPVILLVARGSGLSLMRVGVPALAGLSAMHGFVPPHPGPLAAVAALKADLGLTLALGVLIAVPTVIVGGPLFSRFADRWVTAPLPELFGGPTSGGAGGDAGGDAGSGSGVGSHQTVRTKRPTFTVTLGTVLLPVVLMLGKAIADVVDSKGHGLAKRSLDFIGTPLIALLIAVLVAMVTLGRRWVGQREVGEGGRAVAAPDRRHHLHRRCRRWFQAGLGRQRHLEDHRVLGVRQHRVTAAAGLVCGGIDPARDRIGNGRHGDHRGHSRPGHRDADQLARVAAGAGNRRRFTLPSRTSTMRVSGW